MKKRLPSVVTVVLIIGALMFLTEREWLAGLRRKAPATPESVVWRMSDAARKGDVQAYLDCFSGSLRQSLEKTAADMGEVRFSEYLKKLNNEMTGIAVSDFEKVSEDTATLRVEFVFRGKNEAQKHHFKLVDGKWKIDSLDNAEGVPTLIPYGTRVP